MYHQDEPQNRVSYECTSTLNPRQRTRNATQSQNKADTIYFGGPTGKDRWKRLVVLHAKVMAKDKMESVRCFIRLAFPFAFDSSLDWGEHICAAA